MRSRVHGALGVALVAGSAQAACSGQAASAPAAGAVTAAAPVPSANSAPRLSLSASGGCWLHHGRVWCWNGATTELESGEVHASAPASLEARAPQPAPHLRAIALPVAALDAAGTLRFGCAVLASGAVRCWGDNTWGQLGAASRALESELPLAVLGLDDATAIDVAPEHACAALEDGSVACWGNNASGQCGHDREYAPAVRELVRPERVEGVRGAHRVVVSASSSCALGASDTWCWGELLRVNDGRGPATDRTRAAPIAPLGRARALTLGSECGCAITAEGKVACFALTMHGCPSPDVRAGLEPRFGWSDGRSLAVGDRGACVGRAGGSMACWLHPAREPLLGAPAVPAARSLASSSGVPVIAGGPCILDGSRLVCWSSSFWDDPGGAPLQIRLP
jgi:hypothetical protein